MTLWDLMTALCAVMPLAGALATVRDVHKGWLAYALALIIGVVVGGPCAWAMRSVGSALITLIKRSGAGSDTRRWNFRLLYVGAAAWIILVLFIGSWVAAAVIHGI
jgi:hypothetical protein